MVKNRTQNLVKKEKKSRLGLIFKISLWTLMIFVWGMIILCTELFKNSPVDNKAAQRIVVLIMNEALLLWCLAYAVISGIDMFFERIKKDISSIFLIFPYVCFFMVISLGTFAFFPKSLIFVLILEFLLPLIMTQNCKKVVWHVFCMLLFMISIAALTKWVGYEISRIGSCIDCGPNGG